MIKVNKIIPQTIECFDNQGNSLGLLNEYEFNDLRCQIAEQKQTGYSIMGPGNYKIEIDHNGKLNWEIDMFDLIEKQIARLFKAHQT